jgi:hypothetical protein
MATRPARIDAARQMLEITRRPWDVTFGTPKGLG